MWLSPSTQNCQNCQNCQNIFSNVGLITTINKIYLVCLSLATLNCGEESKSNWSYHIFLRWHICNHIFDFDVYATEISIHRSFITFTDIDKLWGLGWWRSQGILIRFHPIMLYSWRGTYIQRHDWTWGIKHRQTQNTKAFILKSRSSIHIFWHHFYQKQFFFPTDRSPKYYSRTVRWRMKLLKLKKVDWGWNFWNWNC